VQGNDNSSYDEEAKTTTPLSSPVKLSRSNVTHASSAPSSVGVTDTHNAPPLPQSDSDEADKNKKKVQKCSAYNITPKV